MPVRVFKDSVFHRWANGEGVTDAKLCEAVVEIENGLVDARLGGFLIKKRVGVAGRGKSGGYRMIVAHRQGDRLVFLHGFGKHDKENISSKEKKALHKLADYYMTFNNAGMSEMLKDGSIIEVACHEQDSSKRP
jgi:hypothetical protein